MRAVTEASGCHRLLASMKRHIVCLLVCMAGETGPAPEPDAEPDAKPDGGCNGFPFHGFPQSPCERTSSWLSPVFISDHRYRVRWYRALHVDAFLAPMLTHAFGIVSLVAVPIWRTLSRCSLHSRLKLSPSLPSLLRLRPRSWGCWAELREPSASEPGSNRSTRAKLATPRLEGGAGAGASVSQGRARLQA